MLNSRISDSKIEQPLELAEHGVFLIDWLTVVFHDQTVAGVKRLLGLLGHDIPWMVRQSFVYGYPLSESFNNINIRYGADDERFYSDNEKGTADQKVRHDMGICLEMSGSGCRAFEQYGHGDWLKLLHEILDCEGRVSVTRLDLAYDDQIGLLDIDRIRQDVEDRNYVSKSRKAQFIWSDDQDEDIQGLTIEIGSRKSEVLVRIYNKAAERGFDHDRHWIRVELQLRKSRALVAASELLKEQSVGRCAAGVLRNYCTFREPTGDSNKCRWPIADYWEKLLANMEKIKLWISPGEPYNYSKTEHHMLEQYGQAFIAYYRMHGSVAGFLTAAMQRFPVLKQKYETAIAEFKLVETERKKRIRQQWAFSDFGDVPDWAGFEQLAIDEGF